MDRTDIMRTSASHDAEEDQEDTGPALVRTAVAVPALVLAVMVTAALTFTLTTLARPSPPGTSSVAAGFARDMSTHHAQALEMSFLVRGATNDQEVRTLAYDIINTQATQRGMMMGWLELWGLPLAGSGEPMAWMPPMSGMEHGGHDMPAMEHGGHGMEPGGHGGQVPAMEHTGGETRMAGMATQQELAELSDAQGRKAEVLFLQLMTQHHQGGVMMAKAAAGATDRPEVRRLAQKMVQGQQAEIELMTEMLRERGAKPLPWPPHGS